MAAADIENKAAVEMSHCTKVQVTKNSLLDTVRWRHPYGRAAYSLENVRSE
jgi:hypothetical protein